MSNNATDINISIDFDDSKLITNLDAMKSAVNKAMSDVSGSFSNVSSTVNGLISTFDNVSKNITNVFKFIGINIGENSKLINSSINGISSGLAFMQGKDLMMPLIEGFQNAQLQIKLFEGSSGSASLAQAAMNGTLSLGETAVGLMTGKIELATAAQAAWNAVKSLDPTTWLTIGVGALAAGITALVLTMDDENAAQKKRIDTLGDEIKATEDLRSRQAEKLDADIGEIDHVKKLNTELSSLVDINGKVKQGYEDRAKFIVGELNNALGLNIKMVDNEIIDYGNLQTSINDLIEKKKAEVILEAQLPEYKEAVTKVTQEQIEANRLEKEISEGKARAKQIEKELDEEYHGQWMGNNKAMRDARYQEWSDLQEDTNLNQQELDLKQEKLAGYYEIISQYDTNATLIASGNAENYKKVEFDKATAKDMSVSQIKKGLEEEIAAEQNHLDYLNGELKNETDESRRVALQAQIDGSQALIDSKSKEIDGLSDVVRKKGPSYDKEVKNMALKALESFDGDTQQYFGVSEKKFNEMIEGMKSKDPAVKEKAEKSAAKMLKGLESKHDKYSETGSSIIEGMLKGTNSKIGDAYSAMGLYGSNLLNKFKNSLGINSPSKKFAELSKWIPEGISKGIHDNRFKALSSIESFNQDILKSLNPEQISGAYNKLSNAFFIGKDMLLRSALTQSAKSILNVNYKEERMNSLKGELNGVIENHISIDGRETAVALTPFISEEIAFQGGL